MVYISCISSNRVDGRTVGRLAGQSVHRAVGQSVDRSGGRSSGGVAHKEPLMSYDMRDVGL